MIGERFGRWQVVGYANEKNGYKSWRCECECGTERDVVQKSLVSGKSKSCGCLRKERQLKSAVTHGNSGKKRTSEYDTWKSMKNRCKNESHEEYHNYGGRGISVCERWENSFENFINDMGNKPSPKHSIDRIDVNGNYEPSNCRWVTMFEQARNTRIRKDNTSGIKGVTFNKARGSYRSRIYVDGIKIELGNFKKLKEAAKARKEAEKKYWKSSE